MEDIKVISISPLEGGFCDEKRETTITITQKGLVWRYKISYNEYSPHYGEVRVIKTCGEQGTRKEYLELKNKLFNNKNAKYKVGVAEYSMGLIPVNMEYSGEELNELLSRLLCAPQRNKSCTLV